MKQNLLSIIIPVYNREELVIRSIKSILMQNEELCEVVVVDDGSTDNTWGNLAQYEQCAGIRKYKFDKNRGVNAARNYGVSMSCGEYVFFLDSDDYLKIDSLAKIKKILLSYPNIGHFWFNRVDEMTGLKYAVSPVDGEEINFADKIRFKYDGDFVHVIRRSYLKEFPFFEYFRAEEYLNWFRIARKYAPEKYFDVDAVVCSRNTPNSLLRQLRSYSSERMLEKYMTLNKELDLFEADYHQYNNVRLTRVMVKAVLIGVICGQYDANSRLLDRLRYFNVVSRQLLRFFNLLRLRPFLWVALRLKHIFRRD